MDFNFIKKHQLLIICIATLMIAFAISFNPMKAFIFERAEVKKELAAKQAQRDSLSRTLEDIKKNPDDYLERNTRNSGYAKKGETMLPIIPENIDTEKRKLKVSAFLLLAAVIIVVLIIIFAIPKKQMEETEENRRMEDL